MSPDFHLLIELGLLVDLEILDFGGRVINMFSGLEVRNSRARDSDWTHLI
jgi:hypothetical protein